MQLGSDRVSLQVKGGRLTLGGVCDEQGSSDEFEQTLGNSGGQRILAYCSAWSHRVGQDLATKQYQQNLLSSFMDQTQF